MADKSTAERIQQKKNRDAFSDVLAVSQSTWYDFAPVMKAVLKEIAMLQVWDGKAAVTKLRYDHPWKNDIEGWCFASQSYIGARTATTEEVVRKYVKRFKQDGVIEIRTWTDGAGYPHNEYRIIREVVDQKKWPDDVVTFLELRIPPRRGGNKGTNKGSFQKEDGRTRGKPTGIVSQSHRNDEPVATGIVSHNPPESSASCHRNFQPVEDGCEFRQGKSIQVRDIQDRDVQVRASSASDIASGSLRSPRESGDGVMSTMKPAPRPWNQEPTQYRTPLTNKQTYKEVFDGWRPGMLVPKCHRCQELLHPNEPAHVCEGYEPQLPYGDMEDHMELMEGRREQLRDARLENQRDLAQSFGAEDEPTKPCLKCGDELTYEEAMKHECNMAEDDFMAEAAE